MKAQLKATYIETKQKKSKKDNDYRVISVGNADTFERIDFFMTGDAIVPEGIKAGQKIDLTLDIEQQGYKLYVSVSNIKA